MRTRFRLFIVFTFLICENLVAQQPVRTCGTMDLLKQQLQQDTSLLQRRADMERNIQQKINSNKYNADKTSTIITIPVVVHVVYNTSVQNVSDTWIQSQIDVLNEDFSRNNADRVKTPAAFASVAANTGIQFCLAKQDPDGNPTSGITRTKTNIKSFSNYNTNAVMSTSQGGIDIWSRYEYLNIYFCYLSDVCGYASMPGYPSDIDGVVCSSEQLCAKRVLTHEVGHWLGLYHLWGTDTTSACGGIDDYCQDTPNQTKPSWSGGLPLPSGFPLKTVCVPDSPGIMFMNFMDCILGCNLFTTEQSERMNSFLDVDDIRYGRGALKTSKGCVATNPQSIADFNTSNMLNILYPNPTTGKVTLNPNGTDIKTISVCNVLGEVLLQQPFSHPSETYNLEFGNNFPAGLYIISINTEDKVYRQKLIKQ